MTSGPTLLQTNGTISEQEYISCVTGIQGLCPGIGPHIGRYPDGQHVRCSDSCTMRGGRSGVGQQQHRRRHQLPVHVRPERRLPQGVTDLICFYRCDFFFAKVWNFQILFLFLHLDSKT